MKKLKKYRLSDCGKELVVEGLHDPDDRNHFEFFVGSSKRDALLDGLIKMDDIFDEFKELEVNNKLLRTEVERLKKINAVSSCPLSVEINPPKIEKSINETIFKVIDNFVEKYKQQQKSET